MSPTPRSREYFQFSRISPYVPSQGTLPTPLPRKLLSWFPSPYMSFALFLIVYKRNHIVYTPYHTLIVRFWLKIQIFS